MLPILNYQSPEPTIIMSHIWKKLKKRFKASKNSLRNSDAVVQELKDAQLRIRGPSRNHLPPDPLRRNMTSTSTTTRNSTNNPQDEIISSRMAQVQLDENGLVVPKKLFNPCTDSRECQNLHREIRWNAKAGIDVLNTKSELERAMEKRKRNRKEQEKLHEQQASKTPFQKMLEDRAKRLEKIESQTNSDGSEDSGHCSPEPESEFLKVHAQLRGRTT